MMPERAATLDDILAVAGARRISPMGVLPNWSEPDGYPRKDCGWADRHVAQVELGRLFLRAPDRPTCRGARSSYHWKHEAERWRREHVELSDATCTYVTNGAFLVACWLEGLKPRRIRSVPSSPNAMIVLPKRSGP